MPVHRLHYVAVSLGFFLFFISPLKALAIVATALSVLFFFWPAHLVLPSCCNFSADLTIAATALSVFFFFFFACPFSAETRDQTLPHSSMGVLELTWSSATSFVSRFMSFILEIHRTNNFFFFFDDICKATFVQKCHAYCLISFSAVKANLMAHLICHFPRLMSRASVQCANKTAATAQISFPTFSICLQHFRGSLDVHGVLCLGVLKQKRKKKVHTAIQDSSLYPL